MGLSGMMEFKTNTKQMDKSFAQGFVLKVFLCRSLDQSGSLLEQMKIPGVCPHSLLGLWVGGAPGLGNMSCAHVQGTQSPHSLGCNCADSSPKNTQRGRVPERISITRLSKYAYSKNIIWWYLQRALDRLYVMELVVWKYLVQWSSRDDNSISMELEKCAALHAMFLLQPLS